MDKVGMVRDMRVEFGETPRKIHNLERPRFLVPQNSNSKEFTVYIYIHVITCVYIQYIYIYIYMCVQTISGEKYRFLICFAAGQQFDWDSLERVARFVF